MEKTIGTSLFELLLTLALICLLTAISFPLYTQHIAHEKRQATEIRLTQIASALEQYYTIHNTYQGASLATLGFADHTVDSSYQIRIESSSAAHFLLLAQATEKQAQLDAMCISLTLNDLGEKTAQDCW